MTETVSALAVQEAGNFANVFVRVCKSVPFAARAFRDGGPQWARWWVLGGEEARNERLMTSAGDVVFGGEMEEDKGING